MAAEKIFENKVKAYLTEQGAWFIKYWGGARFTKSGIPDLLVCYKGRFVAIEVKADTGEPSLIQLVTLKQIRKANGIGVLLYPKEFANFKKFLESNDINDWYEKNIEYQDKWFKKLDSKIY